MSLLEIVREWSDCIDYDAAFPKRVIDFLESTPRIDGNHPSFKLLEADGSQPALEQLQELIDAGFGRLYADQAAAEGELGARCFQHR